MDLITQTLNKHNEWIEESLKYHLKDMIPAHHHNLLDFPNIIDTKKLLELNNIEIKRIICHSSINQIDEIQIVQNNDIKKRIDCNINLKLS